MLLYISVKKLMKTMSRHLKSNLETGNSYYAGLTHCMHHYTASVLEWVSEACVCNAGFSLAQYTQLMGRFEA